MLRRTAALTALRAAAGTSAAPISMSNRALSMTPSRLGSDYDWNLGVPGSRIRNPAPHLYNDVYPGMGWQWWAWIGLSLFTFFYGNTYDSTRSVKVDIGIFG